MARNFRELYNKMSPAARAEVEENVRKTLEQMDLAGLRQARDLTQEHLAETLNIKQSSVSKIERAVDMYISTLDKVIRAMGGQLEIRAVFPDRQIKINQFRRIGRTKTA